MYGTEYTGNLCSAVARITEAAWRNAHEQTFGGVDAYYTPFIRLEKGEIRNKDKREVLPQQNTVSHLIPQLVASEPEELNQLAGFLASQGYREIDVNMGCPFPLIANRGKGSGILPYPEKVAALLDAMRQLPEIRFSVKMRLGWLHADEWKQVLPLLNGSGMSQITLHPRIGKQQYKGEVNRVALRSFMTPVNCHWCIMEICVHQKLFKSCWRNIHD